MTPTKKKQQAIKITIPVAVIKKGWAAFTGWFKKHVPKLASGLLILLIILFGLKWGCHKDKKGNWEYNLEYEPPDPKTIKEFIDK